MNISSVRLSLKSKLTSAFLFFSIPLLAAFADTAPAGADSMTTAPGEVGVITFVGIFLLGLALNLTPCVYPMLAVTVSIFGGQTEKKTLRVFGRALLYVLGIATMYSALGLVAAMTGGLFGSLLQSRAVLLTIALLFFLLALSMFGLYEIRIPSRLMNKLGGAQTSGLLGIYLSGLFVGIFAAPCIGPPVIALLTAIGIRGDPVFGFTAFFVMSLGLGFPYLLLGTFSGLLNKLPKSGEWMVWVKKLMGIALVCVGLFYLSLAVNPALIYSLIPLTIAVGGIYLGFFEKSQASSSLFTWLKRLTAIAALVGAALFYQSGKVESLDWEYYSAEKFEAVRQSGKPLIIYFSADWCIPCHELDRRTFTDPAVIQTLNRIPRLKVDLTHSDSPEAMELSGRFDIAGVPTIIFFDEQGQEMKDKRLVGFVPPDGLLEHIEQLDSGTTATPAGDNGPAFFIPSTKLGEETPSEAFLISNNAWIQPGQPFLAGVLIVMRDKWHAYWLNPGDSGMEPKMEWNIPEGFTAGPIRRPAPQRFDDPPFVTFGHEKELLLTRKITPPATLKPGETATITVDMEWLMCKKICIGQEAKLTLSLSVRDEPPKPASNLKKIFENHEASLPVSNPDWQFSAEIDDELIRLNIIPPSHITQETIENSYFYPAQSGIVRYNSYIWIPSKQGYTLQMSREGPTPDEKHMRGVLVLPEKTPDTAQALDVNADFIK